MYLEILTASVTIITGLIGFFLSLKKVIIPFLQRRKQRKEIVNKLISELGEHAPAIIAQNLKYLGGAIELLVAKMSLMTRRSNVGIYVCNEQGLNTWVNEPLAEMFGQTPEDMHGYGWLKNVVNREKEHRNWQWAVHNKTPYKDTFQIIVDGEVRTIYTEAYKHVAADNTTVLFYIGFAEVLKEN